MEKLRKLLKNTNGNTLVGLLFAIGIFSIGILPIYKIIITSAKAQKTAEKTYEATLKAQNLLESVKKQIEKDINIEYSFARGIGSTKPKAWLGSGVAHPLYTISDFLEMNDEKNLITFNQKYNTGDFLYELYIWGMPEGKIEKEPIIVSTYALKDLLDFPQIEIQKAAERYFSHKKMSLWTDLGKETLRDPWASLIGIAEIGYQDIGTLNIRGNGFQGENIRIYEIEGYPKLETKAKLSYKHYYEQLSMLKENSAKKETVVTHELIISEKGTLEDDDVIQISIDSTTFQQKENAVVIRIENKTKATVVIRVYGEKDAGNIQVYPIQENLEGNMIVERCDKLEPSKNFIIEIIVREVVAGGLGPTNKVLSKLVDVYAYDYSSYKRVVNNEKQD